MSFFETEEKYLSDLISHLILNMHQSVYHWAFDFKITESVQMYKLIVDGFFTHETFKNILFNIAEKITSFSELEKQNART